MSSNCLKKVLAILTITVSFLFLASCSNKSEPAESVVTESPEWVRGIWVHSLSYEQAQQSFEIDPDYQGDFIITKDSFSTNGWSIDWGKSGKFYEEDGVTLSCTSYPSILKVSNNEFKWQIREDMANEPDYTITGTIVNKGDRFEYRTSVDGTPQAAFGFDLP